MMQMGFKVDQQFRQIQQLSKQQQQSLALLACNQLDLGEAIETFLTENIMLERVSDNPDFKDADDLGDVDYRDASHDEADSDFAMGSDVGDDFNRLGEFDLSELGENVASTITADQDLSDLDSDFSWDEVYQLESMESSAQELDSGHELSLDSGPESTGESMGERLQTEWLRATDETFEQQFYQALANEDFTASETTLLEQLLDALDEQYFLTLPVAEFAKQCRQPLARVSAFVERIKHLNPAGVASQSVAECLLAQLDNLAQGQNSDSFINAYEIVKFYGDFLSDRMDYIKARAGLSEAELDAAMALIRTLEAYPNAQALETTLPTQNIRADIFVHKEWGFFMPRSIKTRVRICKLTTPIAR